MEKLVDIVHFLHLDINKAFGSADSRNPFIQTIGNRQRLGPAGLSLHYANIVLQMDTLVARSASMPANTRDALYQSLPPNIKLTLRSSKDCWSSAIAAGLPQSFVGMHPASSPTTSMVQSMIVKVMGAVVENAIPMLEDASLVHARPGAGMLISFLVQGLRKTLQASAIVASDIVEHQTQITNEDLLPSLIICPSTQVGHWAFEIEKYIDVSVISSFQNAGSAQDRVLLRESFLQACRVLKHSSSPQQ
ncbi:hypothetical protein KIW84_062883 [Lathyrus oleraceus]|uniref:DUF668 domain-containing protein n=1 Tax=Pisum sativum TaxID=3888 RepID=A0A9D4W688_PEA|nr:hypothetical protein KIW84_062883 [Pisum sativum]